MYFLLQHRTLLFLKHPHHFLHPQLVAVIQSAAINLAIRGLKQSESRSGIYVRYFQPLRCFVCYL